MEWNILNLTALALLAMAVADDLRTRKIHNWLSLSALVLSTVAIVFHHFNSPDHSLLEPLKAFGAALVLGLLLFQFNVWGGGDAKMFIAVSPLLLFAETPIYLLCCLVWGSLLGLVFAALNSRLGAMANNLFAVVSHRKGIDSQNLIKVPFSVALLMGYLTLMTLRTAGLT